MIAFRNKFTGTKMFVDESRKEEYILLGHALAQEKTVSEAKKTGRKKTVKKEV